MGLDLSYIDGQTPIDESEKEGLLIETIATQAELDEFEQLNIEEALQWIAGRSLTPKQLFSVKFICDLHKQMFGIVWNWAGEWLIVMSSLVAAVSATLTLASVFPSYSLVLAVIVTVNGSPVMFAVVVAVGEIV
jgi:hypothetical protein